MAARTGFEPVHRRVKVYCVTASPPGNMVEARGFEPPTACVSDRYSNQLSYTSIYKNRITFV